MKKSIALIFLVGVLCSLLFISVSADNGNTIFLRGTDFEQNAGTWRKIHEPDKGAILEVLAGTTDKKPDNAKPATLYFETDKPGTYTVHALTIGFPSDPDGRFSNIEVNGKFLDTKIENRDSNEWVWVKLGDVDLKAGENEIKLIDTGAYWARVQGIILTTDKNLKCPLDHTGMKALLDATDINKIEKTFNPFTFKEDK
ncbi:MAG: hypothetical protein IKJ55_08225, partial [Clostridia bacterium]|nr:hypothetical protein [Clostridia bacterium]